MSERPNPLSDAEFGRQIAALIPFLVRHAVKNLHTDLSSAEDLVQDTMFLAWRAREKFDGRDMKAWLFTILRNINFSKQRHWNIVQMWQMPAVVNERGELIEYDAPVPGDQEASARLGDLATALREIPKEQAEAVLLLGLGYSYEEAALITGTPEGTLKSRAHRGREALKAKEL